jgi:hypothetical protein
MNPNDAAAESVFTTDDPGLVPLAKIALESAGIDYQARSAGKADNLQWTLSQSPTNRPVVIEFFVSSDDAARARDLLSDLAQSTTVGATDPSVLTITAESQAIQIRDVTTGLTLARVSEEELQQISSHLEEDGPEQFVVDAEALESLRHAGADPRVVGALSQALGDQDQIRIAWTVEA